MTSPPSKKGHYELDLSLPIHRFAAARLRDQAHSEPAPEGAATWLNLVLDDFSGWESGAWGGEER